MKTKTKETVSWMLMEITPVPPTAGHKFPHFERYLACQRYFKICVYLFYTPCEGNIDCYLSDDTRESYIQQTCSFRLLKHAYLLVTGTYSRHRRCGVSPDLCAAVSYTSL